MLGRRVSPAFLRWVVRHCDERYTQGIAAGWCASQRAEEAFYYLNHVGELAETIAGSAKVWAPGSQAWTMRLVEAPARSPCASSSMLSRIPASY